MPSSSHNTLLLSDHSNTLSANNFAICPNCGLDLGSGFLIENKDYVTYN